MATQLYQNVVQPVIPLATTETGEKVYQTPESTNPLIFEGTGEAADRSKSAFGLFNQSVAEIEQQRMLGNPDYVKRLEGYRNEATRKLTELYGVWESEIAKHEAVLANKANFKFDDKRLNYVVGTFSGFTDAQRQSALLQLVEEKAGPELAILHQTSNVFTSLKDEQHASIKPLLFKRVDEQTFNLWQQSSRNLTRVDKGLLTAIDLMNRLAADAPRIATPKPPQVRTVGFTN